MSSPALDSSKRTLVVSGLLAGMLACASQPADPVVRHVRAMMASAKAAEPAVTSRLQEVAARFGGHLHKLEYRLKTERSAVRKVRVKMRERDESDPERVVLDDMLRFTMVLEDAPPGNYVAAVHDCLARLEADGHAVEQVKNYWPAGDNYSGVNTILHTPAGLPWELQFHTSASIAAQTATRAQYEELRLTKTPAERKQALFDAMTKTWDAVPIPKGVLEQDNLHANEIIRDRPRPKGQAPQ